MAALSIKVGNHVRGFVALDAIRLRSYGWGGPAGG